MRRKLGFCLLALPFIGILAIPTIDGIRRGDLGGVLIGYGIAIAVVGCVVGGIFLIERNDSGKDHD